MCEHGQLELPRVSPTYPTGMPATIQLHYQRHYPAETRKKSSGGNGMERNKSMANSSSTTASIYTALLRKSGPE